MKRVISLILCLVMCVSFFSATATQVYALGKTEDIFTVEKTEFKNDKITYTISLKPNQEKLIGTIIKAEFDSSVLEVSSESGAVGSVNSYGEFAANVTGYYEEGITYDNENVYSVAYMNPNGFNIGADGKKFIKVAFNAISEKRPVTEVKFYCEEYITEDGNDDNDIKKNDGKQLICADQFFTLNPAENVEVSSCVDGLKFTWTEAVGAEWYNIYRKEAISGNEFTEWELYDTADAGVTEYIDETIEKGKEYYYSIESANEYGVREYDKTGLVGFDFGTITEVDAELTERGAKVSWGALDYAVSYTVYRQAEGETSWKKIGDTTATSFEDAPLMSNVEYSYKVKAHHEKGYTADTSCAPAKITFIANAAIVEYELNFNDIVINWKGVNGAVGYEIYRKATGENGFTLIGEVEIPGYTDTDVVDGKEYSYKVRSLVDRDTKAGSVLGEESFDLIKLPVVTDIVATLGGDNVSVSWEAVDLAEAYVILRQDNNNGNWFEITTVNAPQTKYYDRAVNSGKTYTYAIRTKADAMITNEFKTSNSVYYLEAPTVAGVQNGSKGIEFTFDKVVGASAYNIYRRDVNASGFGKPIGTISATKETVYVDSTAVSGGIYVYGVQSVYGDVLSGISESSVICCLEEPKLTLTSIYGGIQLKWNAVPSAEKYIVYYGGTSKDLTKMVVLGEVTGTSYFHKNGTSGRSNWFAIEAVCGETISTKTAKSIYYFAAPVVELIDNMSNGIKVRWNIISGAESYILYRKAGNATTWTKVATVYEDGKLPYVQYTDKKVKSGTKYTYTIKAYDGDEYSPYNSTGWSKEYLSTPKIKSIDNYYGGPKISWGKVTGAKKYEIYRKTKSSDWKSIGTTSSTSYIDSSAKNGTKYYYAIRAIDGSSKSYYSTSHFNDNCKTVTYSADLILANTTGTDIKVSWNKVSGAKKYEVYRKKGSAKKWTKVKTTTSTSYTDKKVKNGETYKYMVKALNSKSKTVSSSDSTTIRCIAAPKLSSVKSAKSGITFKWNKVSGASGYYVYRKTGSGDYEKIATVKGGTKVSYLDKKAKKGKTYYYTVKAYYKTYSSAYRSGLKIKDKY